jgi:NADH-quinone oxidoreductase subunit N
LWLVILALAFSAVSLYDYLQVLKRIYVFEAPPLALSTRILEVSQVPLAVMALVVLVLGSAPEWLIAKLGAAINLAGP